MATQTDVKAVTVSATGALKIGGVAATGGAAGSYGGGYPRIKGIYYSCATGGTVAITDGGSGGPTLLSIVVPVGAACIWIPGEGIRCNLGDPYLTLTTAVGSITIFYG
jgi:hypothetical protein